MAAIPVPLCTSYTADGDLCGRITLNGVRCGIHCRQYAKHVENFGAPRENQCENVTRRRRCDHDKREGSSVCQEHFDAFRQMREYREGREFIGRTVNDLIIRNPRPTWQSVIRDYVEIVEAGTLDEEVGRTIARRFAASQIMIHPYNLVEMYWDWVADGQQGEEPQLEPFPQLEVVPPPVVERQPTNRLHALARDRQNVHTQEVTEQTNKATELLLGLHRKYCGTKTFRSVDWAAAKWLPESYGSWERVAPVVNDMKNWYEAVTCRTHNDRLYKKMLDGLYQHLKRVEDKDTQKELYKRLFEECLESVGMCCEGHLSRLCNVLVGFEEAFEPPVPVGDILQIEIAKISRMETTLEEKITDAKKVFDHLKIGEDARAVWLDALAAL